MGLLFLRPAFFGGSFSLTKAQQRGDLAPAHASQLRQAGIFRVPSFTDELVLVGEVTGVGQASL
jgi:hypothetical protein